MRSVVVFPAPLGPRNPVTLPIGTSKLKRSTAVTAPKRFESPRTSIAAEVPCASDIATAYRSTATMLRT